MDPSSILETISSIIPVDQIVEFLNGIADKVPALEGIISTLVGLISGTGA